jgi:hypothetical protein
MVIKPDGRRPSTGVIPGASPDSGQTPNATFNSSLDGTWEQCSSASWHLANTLAQMSLKIGSVVWQNHRKEERITQNLRANLCDQNISAWRRNDWGNNYSGTESTSWTPNMCWQQDVNSSQPVCWAFSCIRLCPQRQANSKWRCPWIYWAIVHRYYRAGCQGRG